MIQRAAKYDRRAAGETRRPVYVLEIISPDNGPSGRRTGPLLMESSMLSRCLLIALIAGAVAYRAGNVKPFNPIGQALAVAQCESDGWSRAACVR